MSEYKDMMTGSEVVDDTISSYADYTIATKFPNVIDGIKPVSRRILYTLHEVTQREHKTKMKEATLAGRVMEYHPHGDASISGAISTMSQPFTHIVPLVFSDSNVGTYSGEAPAAPRYVDVCESEAAKSLFFTDINPAMFKLVMCEAESGTEPANFIPRLPTALLVPVFGIAIGYQTRTVACSVEDLCQLTKEYIRLRNSCPDWSDKTRSLIKYMLPDYPTSCLMRNSKQLLHDYRQGKFSSPILLDGTMRVCADRIIISTLPPDKTFKTTTSSIGREWRDSPSGWVHQTFAQTEDFTDQKQGEMYGDFNCVLRRGINPFDVLAQLKKKLQFTSSWSPDRRYVDEDGKMTVETPLTLLDKWYNVRYYAVLGDLKQTLNQMVNEQRKLLAQITVVDHTDEVVQIVKTSENDDETIRRLGKRFNLTKFQASFIASLKLSQLNKQGKADLIKALEKVRADMRELQAKFNKVPEIMIEHVEKFERQFAKDYPRHCIIPKYIGCACYKGTGWIMLEDESEMDQILKDFNDPELVEFKLFNGIERNLVALGADEEIVGDLPKYLKAGGVAAITDKDKYTACVCKNGGALVLEGLKPQLANMSLALPVGQRFTVVSKTGERDIVEVNDKIIRKSYSSGPTMRDVVSVSPIADNECIIVHASSAQPNYLLLERVRGKQKLHKLVVGQWHVLAIIPVCDDKVVINIPKDVRARCNVRHLVLENLSKAVPYGKVVGLLYGRGPNAYKSDFDIVPYKRKSTIMKAVLKSK